MQHKGRELGMNNAKGAKRTAETFGRSRMRRATELIACIYPPPSYLTPIHILFAHAVVHARTAHDFPWNAPRKGGLFCPSASGGTSADRRRHNINQFTFYL